MTALFTKAGRVSAFAALLVVAVAAGAFAQNGKRKTPGSDICVAKKMADYEDANYDGIQKAVNAARPGQVIEILDTETYEEQVTIDGRDKSPWIGSQTVGKNGITIRYVPPGGAKAAWNHPRPTIKYRDITNTHPQNNTEAKRDNELTGAGNFETNGALRILRAKNVTIEGIAVDGGGPFAFGATGVWCDKNGGNCNPLFHGNAAITLAVAGQVTIRDCDLKNAYFGINIKDRNTGGVFGNPNVADQDTTVPLSNFGLVGGHLFEYNKINNNVVGLFFESAWDLGSTVRYNLIYGNKIANQPNIASLPEPNNQNAGAFMFKDMYLSPVAIYNNTLYDNSGNFCGHWQAGGQHLVFNNIFSKSRPSENKGNDHMSMDGKFPFRMYHCVFSTDSSYLQLQRQDNYCSSNPETPGGRFVADLRFQGTGFANPTRQRVNVSTCNNGNTPSGQTQGQDMVLPGALIAGLGQGNTVATPFSSKANIRWLQTEGLGGAWSELLPSLFKSLRPADADFLVPDWENKAVQNYIKNKGWPDAGIRNNDGSIADLGAIPSTGERQTTVARILPTAVVLLSGGGANAAANFSLKVDNGTLNNPKIKLLRWIAPIPTNTLENEGVASTTDPTGGNWPSRMRPVAAAACTSAINNTSAVKIGNNSFNFTTGKSVVPKYGFFEIIVEGTDANGKTVTSDIGFLPYRELQYFLDITVYDGSTAVTTVKAGQTYRLHVERRCASGVSPCPTTVNELTYTLQSGPTAFMRFAANGDTLSYEKNVTFAKDYSIYFSRAGDETIFASGLYVSGSNRATFIGTKDIIVRPGDPAKAVFTDPIPVSQLGTAPAPVINRGVDREVKVEVQDKFGNAVDQAVQVTVASSDIKIGDVGASAAAMNTKAASTDPKTGVVTFIAKVTNGATGQTFDMTATLAGITQNDKDNIGRLRLGRALDRLEVFYSDTAKSVSKPDKWADYYDPSVKIEGNVGDWFLITVKVLVGDTVNTGRPNQFILVSPGDENLIFSSTRGGAAETIFALNGGVAKFWVSTAPGTSRDVSDAVLTVYALRSKDAEDFDQSIQSGGRGDINFRKLSTSIDYAVVYGDGQGRPESVVVKYKDGGASLTDPGAKPSKVTLNWGGVVLTASSVDVVDGTTLRAAFTGGARPTGYTSISGLGSGLVEVTGGVGGAEAVEKSFDVFDGIGPILANGGTNDGAGERGPVIVENLDGRGVDTITIILSEEIRDPAKFKTLLYAAGPGEPAEAAAGIKLNVISATSVDGRTYRLEVTHTADGPAPGGWIRLDPSNSDGVVADVANKQSMGTVDDNKPHEANRWAQLKLQELAPEIKTAYYTGDASKGKPDFAYLVFNKKVEPDKWFTGGTVSFNGSSAVAVTDPASLFSASGDVLKVTLSLVTKFDKITTSGEIPFTFKYGSGGSEWGTLTGSAKDSAAPVLATKAVLKTGSLKSDGSTFNDDTLRVYYSEQLSAASQGVANPVTLKAKDGRYPDFQPVLERFGAISYDRASGYFEATYVIKEDLWAQGKFPKVGDSVYIYEYAGIGDNMEPSIEQTKFDNIRQPLVVDRAANWTTKVKKNPFVSSGSMSDSVVLELSNNPKGADVVDVKAVIRVFDNVGALVVDTMVRNAPGEGSIKWSWYGHNKKGRLVGTGTYLMRATCESTADNDRDIFKVDKMLGVVRGKND